MNINIVLPKKVEVERPVALNDEIYQMLLNDPAFPQFSNTPIINQPQQNQYSEGSAKAIANNTQAAETTAANNATVLVDNTNSNWVNNRWRPAMGWMYMVVCIMDFVLFPILWSVLQALSKGQVTQQWSPITLQGAGLFHVAMGAILGIAVYGRTKEKLGNVSD